MNNSLLGISAAIAFRLQCFTNNLTLDEATELGDLTLTSLSGGSAVTLSSGSWSPSISTGLYTATYPDVTFTFAAYVGSPVTIYGAAVFDNTLSKLLWAEKLPTPFVVPNAGGILVVAVTYMDGACP